MSSKKLKALPGIARLRLEAIFHPKFENETPDSEIRRRMLANVSASRGYLEASLKHSGSLLLWSGRQRFYSKNSTNNSFSRIGEILLMRHFARCFGSNWRIEYERCGEFVRRRRLTCSFEVVTSFLGHHGDIPKRDYLILIAVADRNGGGRFYSTAELVKFAHEFRLPHNDAWVFSSRAACESLFDSYDGMREMGTASTVIRRLDEIVAEDAGCAKVSSLCPHDLFQGEILEGIVIRYVPHAEIPSGEDRDDDGGLGGMKELGAASEELLGYVPQTMEPNGPLNGPAENNDSSVLNGPAENNRDGVLRADLRALAKMDDFDERVENLLRSHHGENLRKVHSWGGPGGGEGGTTTTCDLVNVASDILSSDASDCDRETADIARLVRSLERLNIAASYKMLTEETSKEGERHLCILHVHHDSAFQKYNSFVKREGGGGMMLFRGFSVEVLPATVGGGEDDNGMADANESPRIYKGEDNEEKLMLKMKFLPYMVRTFICRNGLSILRGSGDAAFLKYSMDQLTKWRMSESAKARWIPFFEGWARYCSSPDASLPPLASQTYLHHYGVFERLYVDGEFRSGPAHESSFHGMIVVVGPSKSDIENLSGALSKELSCSKVVRDINGVAEKDVLLSMQRSGGGLLCIAEIEDGNGKVKKLARHHHEAIYILMVDGDLDKLLSEPLRPSSTTISVPGTGEDRLNKIKGKRQGWRMTRCNMLLDLPKEAAWQTDEETALGYLHNDPTARAVLDKLKESSGKKQDDRPGLVVYFPSIPGSGKSALCQDIASEDLGISDDRQLISLEGDELKKRFYGIVEKEVLSKPASIAILDKNAPPISLSTIHGLCVKSQSVALAAIPDCIKDTLVGDGASSHAYPFSLRYLAVCMSRVLGRKPESHKGKLDLDCCDAGMIVVKFYCFYRDVTASSLKERLQSIGDIGKIAIVPFFRENMGSDLPPNLTSVLKDAIVLQTREDRRTGHVSDEDKIDMESRLRSSIGDHRSYIEGLTVSLEESRRAFVAELTKTVASLPDKLEARTAPGDLQPKHIKIASLDFDYEALHAEIAKLRNKISELEQYFGERKEHHSNDENDKSKNRFITSVHCTFAHCSQMSQSDMISTFQRLLGTIGEARVVSILFNDEVAALELEIPPELPRPRNRFPHVTVWCSEGTDAVESNRLPEKVTRDEAKKIVFGCPVLLKGIFRFWHGS